VGRCSFRVLLLLSLPSGGEIVPSLVAFDWALLRGRPHTAHSPSMTVGCEHSSMNPTTAIASLLFKAVVIVVVVDSMWTKPWASAATTCSASGTAAVHPAETFLDSELLLLLLLLSTWLSLMELCDGVTFFRREGRLCSIGAAAAVVVVAVVAGFVGCDARSSCEVGQARAMVSPIRTKEPVCTFHCQIANPVGTTMACRRSGGCVGGRWDSFMVLPHNYGVCVGSKQWTQSAGPVFFSFPREAPLHMCAALTAQRVSCCCILARSKAVAVAKGALRKCQPVGLRIFRNLALYGGRSSAHSRQQVQLGIHVRE
jgi:hypothetical protein